MHENYEIPFNRPCIEGDELEYVRQAISQGHASGDGPFTRRCHALLEEALGVPKVMLTTSCTDALEMCALLLDIRPGDEVVVPSFTFVSTANAFVLRGACPVFSDIRPDTANLDETQLESLITDRTKAIVPVHYAGVACEMDPILDIAQRHGVHVVEDNAHGLFGKYKGRYLGTMGCLATQSFHETKNFSCGEGGALVINDETFIDRAEILRDKGTNRAQFFRGQTDKYTWVDLGSSFLPADLLAAVLCAQLEARAAILAKRKAVWDYYATHLADWAVQHDICLPVIPDNCEQAYHMFYIVLPDPAARAPLIDHLKTRGILAVFHYVPLHLSEMGQRLGAKPGDCPVTEDMSRRLLRLPLCNDLSNEEQDKVIEGLRSFMVESH